MVRESLCTKDMELLTVSLRPHYLPWEFPQVFVTVVYIHPNANESDAAETLSNVTHRLQSLSPDAPNIILGDFNNCTLSKSLRNFYQYVTCPTRYNKTLDLCFRSVKGLYKSIPLPPLSNCVHLIPVYRTALQRGKVIAKRVKIWTEDSSLTLQGCMDSTDWNIFVDSRRDIDELADVVSSWASCCEEIVLPDKTVKIYPNSRPWVSKFLRILLNKKRHAFKQGKLLEFKGLQKEVKFEIRRAKQTYKEEVEDELSSNSLGSAWDVMKTMTGLQDSKCRKKMVLDRFDSKSLADKLNRFYLWFDVNDISKESEFLKANLSNSSPVTAFNERSVVNIFKHCKRKTRPGPDNIGSHLLSSCWVPFFIEFLCYHFVSRGFHKYGNSPL